MSAYRAYLVPHKSFDRREQIIADFAQVRAVYLRWNAPYFRTSHSLAESKEKTIHFDPHPFYVYSTGEGVLLLLLTPLPDDYGDENPDESAARDRISSARSTIVALMGRNAAYNHEFDMSIQCSERTINSRSHLFGTPQDDTPLVNNEGVGLVNIALNRMHAMNYKEQERIRLGLRWHQRSLGDELIARDTEEGRIDSFVNSWLALETLLMQGYTNISPIIGLLAQIHSLSKQRAGEMFPIGRIFNLRGKILHEGHIIDLSAELLKFMNDLFADSLLHTLGLPNGQYTEKYLNGAAQNLL